jgi:hypothetical protein
MQLTTDIIREYTEALRAEWDGVGRLEPRSVVCPACGAIIEGSAQNIDRHIHWHAYVTGVDRRVALTTRTTRRVVIK